MEVVIDTNIIISALLSPDHAAFTFLSDVLDGKFLSWFRHNAIWIEPKPTINKVLDEKDRIFYDTARCSGSKLVTGNFRHYPVEENITALWEIETLEF